MPSRRQFLQDALVLPLAAASLTPAAGPRIFAAPDCLSQESAKGFWPVLHAHGPANLIVVCGAITHPRVYAAAVSGAWILWEMPPFRSQSFPAVALSPGDLYIRYQWPQAALTRAFSRMIPVDCSPAEAIAHYRGVPVAMRRRVGRGGIVYLGSMLGPNLRADEPEAHQLAKAIFSEIACAGTSTTA
jgi:hypothetical protein